MRNLAGTFPEAMSKLLEMYVSLELSVWLALYCDMTTFPTESCLCDDLCCTALIFKICDLLKSVFRFSPSLRNPVWAVGTSRRNLRQMTHSAAIMSLSTCIRCVTCFLTSLQSLQQ